jgi:hypothetical protein
MTSFDDHRQTMTPRLTLKRQNFTQVSPKEIERARTDPDVLKELVSSPKRRRTDLDIYWHAVPYLLTGLAQNMDEPYRWFIEGGETLGKNDIGDIRYLSPKQAMELAAALEDEPPDELGLLMFDEAKMDRYAIYPSRWVAWSENDHLGTMRELYSYVRELIASSSKETGLLIHLEAETIDDDVPEPTAAARRPMLRKPRRFRESFSSPQRKTTGITRPMRLRIRKQRPRFSATSNRR